MTSLLTTSAGTPLLEVVCARRWTARYVGLLNHVRLASGTGLLLCGTRSIHTRGMAFPIDLVFLDPALRVVGKALSVQPGRWRVRGPWCAAHVLEVTEGWVKAQGSSIDLGSALKVTGEPLGTTTSHGALRLYPRSLLLASIVVGAIAATTMQAVGWLMIGVALWGAVRWDLLENWIPDRFQLLGLSGSLLSVAPQDRFLLEVGLYSVGLCLLILVLKVTSQLLRLPRDSEMGWGDIKLLGWVGLAAGGLATLPWVLILSVFVAMPSAWRLGRSVPFAFAPALAVAALLVVFVRQLHPV